MCRLQKAISNFLVITQNLKLYVSSSLMAPLFSSWQMLSFSSATIFSDLLWSTDSPCWKYCLTVERSLSQMERQPGTDCTVTELDARMLWMTGEWFWNIYEWTVVSYIHCNVDKTQWQNHTYVIFLLVFMYEHKGDSRKQSWKPA